MRGSMPGHPQSLHPIVFASECHFLLLPCRQSPLRDLRRPANRTIRQRLPRQWSLRT
jgi:hypothetical protein